MGEKTNYNHTHHHQEGGNYLTYRQIIFKLHDQTAFFTKGRVTAGQRIMT